MLIYPTDLVDIILIAVVIVWLKIKPGEGSQACVTHGILTDQRQRLFLAIFFMPCASAFQMGGGRSL